MNYIPKIGDRVKLLDTGAVITSRTMGSYKPGTRGVLFKGTSKCHDNCFSIHTDGGGFIEIGWDNNPKYGHHLELISEGETIPQYQIY
jgi:hypothetical protein